MVLGFKSIGKSDIGMPLILNDVQGVTFPALIAMFGVWSPPLERSKMSTIALSGIYLYIRTLLCLHALLIL